MTVYYVSGDYGASGETGSTWETAIDTIAEAIANSSGGDRIVIDAGTYAETISLPHALIFQASDRLGAAGNVVLAGTITNNGFNLTLDVDPAQGNYFELQGDVTVASVALTESDIADIASAVAAAVGSTGDGSVVVDWDYGGMTAYATAGGVPIDNATVRAYLTSDYTAYRRGSGYIKAQTTTNVLGRFTDPMHLDPGAYTLVWVKQGIAGPDTVTLTVE